MIPCLICEKPVADDKLGPHSAKCREVFEYEGVLKEIVIKMHAHAEKAEKMRNTLETYTAKQQMYTFEPQSPFHIDLLIVSEARKQVPETFWKSAAVQNPLAACFREAP